MLERLRIAQCKLLVAIAVYGLPTVVYAQAFAKKDPSRLWNAARLTIEALGALILLVSVVVGLYYVFVGLREMSTEQQQGAMGAQQNAGSGFIKLVAGTCLISVGTIISMVLFTGGIEKDESWTGGFGQ